MRKKLIYIAVVLLVVVAIGATLIRNKKELDEARTPEDRTHIPISVLADTVGYQVVNTATQYPATIQPYDEAKVYAEMSGLIASLNIELGQRVVKGQVLGLLDTRILQINLKQAQIDAQTAADNQQKLLDDYNRARDLYEHKAGLETSMLTAKNNYENAANTYHNALNQVNLVKEQLSNARIISPLSGIISAHNVKQGEYVNPGTPIAAVTNINTLKATVFVDQATAYQLVNGQLATIGASVFGEKQLTGKVSYISPVADANHNYQVDLLVGNKDGIDLKGGTDVQVSFDVKAQRQALVIPKGAVVTDAAKPYVYIIEQDKAVPKTISVGEVMGNRVEVLSGLEAGQQVITSGQINLQEGSIVRILKN